MTQHNAKALTSAQALKGPHVTATGNAPWLDPDAIIQP
jgi:uncharacterized Fe-S cluster protein YjdI